MEKSFFRNVLGTEPPTWPAGLEPSDKVRVQVWTYLVPDVQAALRKEKQIVTGDADTLDACAAWFNLVGRVVEAVTTAKIIRLQ